MTLLKLGFSVIGIYACFLTWGVLQERISTTPYGDKRNGRFRYFIFMNMIQSFTASTIGFLYLLIIRKEIISNINLALFKKLIQVSFFGTIGSPFGYASLKHIDYPTIVLGKSCKLIPVMMMNIILYKKRFPLYKYFVVFLITAGVSSFMLLQPINEKKKTVSSNSLYGIMLLMMNLLIDGITNSTQDQIFHKFNISGQQMMVFMNLFGGSFMLTYLMLPISSELNDAIQFCTEYPEVLKDIFLFALCGAVGQCFIFSALQSFGSLFLISITVTRKLFTVLLSIFWFDHRLSIGQWFAIALVFSGIGIETYVKQLENSNRSLEKKQLVNGIVGNENMEEDSKNK